MSATIPPTPTSQTPPQATATTRAIFIARDAPTLISNLESANPALAAQLTGAWDTYAKAGASPAAGAVAGWLVGQAVGYFGLACTATVTTGCWSPDFVNDVSRVLAVLGTVAGGLVMHWISKAPTRAVLAASVPAKPAA